MINKEFIEKIENLSVQIIETDTGKFAVSKDHIRKIKAKDPVNVQIRTLSGFAKYCRYIEGIFDQKMLFVNIHDYYNVKLSYINEDKDNLNIASCFGTPLIEHSSQYTSTELKNTLLQHFVINDDLEAILEILSSLRSIAETQIEDNGLTTIIITNNGVATKSKRESKYIYSLIPRAGFPDLELPPRGYFFRISKDLRCSLLLVEQPEWQYQAITRIGVYLNDKLNENIHSIAEKDASYKPWVILY